jgi:hypothetical protein
MSTKQPRLKCRWCDWSTPLWHAHKGGHHHSGWDLLYDHAWEHHFAALPLHITNGGEWAERLPLVFNKEATL